MKGKLVAVLVTWGWAIVVSSCTQPASPASALEAEATSGPVRSVQAVAVGVADLPLELSFTGQVQARSLVPISGELPGRVSEVLVKEGDLVQAGELVAVLDSEQIRLQVEQAEKGLQTARKQVEQLQVVADIENQSVEQGIKQALAGLKQVRAQAALVRKGARPEQKRQVEAVVEATQSHMEGMRREHERMGKLYDEKAIPKQKVDQIRDAYEVSEAQYRQAVEQLKLVRSGARAEEIEAIDAAVEQMEAAVDLARIGLRRVDATRLQIEAAQLGIEQGELGLAQAKLALEKSRILAPVAGRIEQVMVEVGQVVGPGIPVALLNVPDDLEVVTYLNDDDVVLVPNRAGAEVVVEALKEAGPIPVSVTDIATIPDTRTGGYAVRMAPGAKETSRLRAGMFVRGTLRCGVHSATAVIPVKAVLRAAGVRYVMVVDGDTARRREIRPGITRDEVVEVLEGLKAGELVLTQGHLGLDDGALIVLND